MIKRIIKGIIWIILVLILGLNIYNYISVNVLHEDVPTINGYGALEVASGSMEPTINKGDIIIINENKDDYKKDDIITFKAQDGSIVTHRIVNISEKGIETKGDANNSVDNEYLEKNQIIGVYEYKINNLGLVIKSFQNPVTIFLILIIGIIVCILMSIDKDGNVKDLTEEEKEFLEYKKKKLKEEKLKNKNKEVKEVSNSENEVNIITKDKNKINEETSNSSEEVNTSTENKNKINKSNSTVNKKSSNKKNKNKKKKSSGKNNKNKNKKHGSKKKR